MAHMDLVRTGSGTNEHLIQYRRKTMRLVRGWMSSTIILVPIIEKGTEMAPPSRKGFMHQPPFAPLKFPAWR